MNGSMVSTGIRSIELLTAVKFKTTTEKVVQTFSFESTKTLIKFAFDKRFDVYNKLNEKIKEVSLSTIDDCFTFLERIEETDKIIIEYSYAGDIDKDLLKNYYFVIPAFLPPYTGCSYCLLNEEQGEFIFCKAKNKIIPQALKRCVIFRQRKLFKT